MALRKSQLYSSLWHSCDELRGGMDASQYKDCILTLLSVKYVSDKYDTKPSRVIQELSEDQLTRFADLPLLSRYDVYQRLMDYWADAMQDDVYLIAADGWLEAAKPRGVIDDREKKIKETPDLVVKKKKYKMDMIPPALIVTRYFGDEQAQVEILQAKHEDATRELKEFVEEHAVEEGFLEAAMNDQGKVTKGGVNERLEAIEDEPESDDERTALTQPRSGGSP